MIIEVKKGDLFLCQQLEDGSIVQVGTTIEQSKLLQAFCAVLSKETPLVRLTDPDYRLKKVDLINK